MSEEKEIIIDGVDVSECEKLGETINGFTCGLGKRIRFANEIITKHNLCKDNPECYFKQLKRLQEENEKLKADLKGETEQCQKWYQLETDKHFQMLEYRQALEEIRDLAELEGMLDENLKVFYPANIQRILDKINEALNVENN